jgi:hypothetical protein
VLQTVDSTGVAEEWGRVRKFLIWTVIIFAAFYLITQPEGAAAAVRSAAGFVGNAFSSVITFLSTLFA